MIGRVIHERYRIQSLVAVGGQARVYKAVQSGLGRTVAVKFLAVDPVRQVPDRQLERFMLEAARASRLTSPTTITIFDYGRTDDGFHFVVTEDVEGITLARCLERDGRLPILPAATIVGQVCLSLREAHAAGVVHGNIEPGNIVLVDGHQDQVKVLGFGIARPSGDAGDGDRESTSSRNELGAPEYMAPESIDGRADIRADIYSVGAVLYRSLTGRAPFTGKTATRTLLKATRDPVPAIDPHLGVPHAIEQVVMACLEKDRERRPRSIEDVLYALQVGVLEMHSAARRDPAPAPIHAMIEPAAEELIAAVQPPDGETSPAPGWSARATVKLLVAGAAMFSVGAAIALFVRFSLSDRDAVDPAPPAARPERVAPAAGSTAHAPAPPASPDPAPAANTEVSPPSEAEADDEDEPRRQRDSVRKRRSDRSSRSREHVPEGYKESPY